MNTVTYFSTLMRYAIEEAEARKSGDPVRIEKATANHAAYRILCLQSDEMSIPPPSNVDIAERMERSE